MGGGVPGDCQGVLADQGEGWIGLSAVAAPLPPEAWQGGSAFQGERGARERRRRRKE